MTSLARFARRAFGVLCALAFFATSSARAQQLSFRGVPWGISGDSLRHLMEDRGFHDVYVDSAGNMVFQLPAVEVNPVFLNGRLVAMTALTPVEPAAMESRWHQLGDSLRAALGSPNQVQPGSMVWQRGLTTLALEKHEASRAQPALLLGYTGPGWAAASAQVKREQAGLALLDSAWLVVGSQPGHRFSVDTLTLAQRGPGVYRLTMREDFAQVQSELYGSYDEVIRGSDVDCVQRRTQLRTRATLLHGRLVHREAATTIWVAARPGTIQAWQVDMVCRYVTERATPPAQVSPGTTAASAPALAAAPPPQ